MARRLVIALALGAAACGPAEAPTGTSFIALERDFQGYEAWEALAFDGELVDEAHTAGPRKVFLN